MSPVENYGNPDPLIGSMFEGMDKPSYNSDALVELKAALSSAELEPQVAALPPDYRKTTTTFTQTFPGR